MPKKSCIFAIRLEMTQEWVNLDVGLGFPDCGNLYVHIIKALVLE